MVIELIIAMLVWLLERFLPWSILVSLALWWGKSKVIFRPSRLALLMTLGFIEDVARIHFLGLRSALLICLMMAAWLIARYYQSRQLWWWYLLGISGELGMMVINRSSFSLIPLVFQVIFLVVIDWWSERFGKRDAIYVKP